MAIQELTIRELGSKGDGIHHGTREPVYVDRALPGEKVKAEVYRDDQDIPRGDILEILRPSPERVAAPCVHYDRCGNCTLQHLSEKYYREWKVAMVKDALRDLAPERWLETLFLGRSNRRRATFATYKFGKKVTMGYYRRRSQEISDIDTCLVADPRILELRETLKPFLAPVLREGTTTDIFLQLVGNDVDLVISGYVGKTGEPDLAVEEALEVMLHLTPVSRISWRAAENDPIQVIHTKDDIVAKFGALKVELPPFAFLQPTVEGEQALVKAVLDALPEKGRLADLFSGCGTFSGPMLARGPVEAYEMSPAAVKALAKAAGGKPLKAIARNLYTKPLTLDELARFDAVVFDPPRGGCREQVATLAKSKVPVLVGVSCNPATFARDARILRDGGYRLQTLQIIDQFLWSHHVEVVGTFAKG